MYSDTHAHLTSECFNDSEIVQMLERASLAGLSFIVNICTDRKTLERGLKLGLLCAGATTPHDVEQEEFSFFAEMARSGKLIAVGETGLDYYNAKTDHELQKESFTRYAALACECGLPLIIHCRNAFEDLFKLLKSQPFVLHCFTGNLKEAQEVIERGGYLSLSGILTFKKSEELRMIARQLPLERLLIETDTPYLAPQLQRGQVNEPAFVVEVAKCLAFIKGLPVEEVAQATSLNAKRFFCC